MLLVAGCRSPSASAPVLSEAGSAREFSIITLNIAHGRKDGRNQMLSTTKEKGAGLGLAIVNKVTEAHGGKVELESDPARGTEITMHMPA